MQRKFRTQAEQAAYALGLQDGKPKSDNDKPLTIDEVRAMSQAEVVDRYDEVQEVLKNPVPVPASSTGTEATTDD
jgi:hypothetical protein